MVLTTIQLHIIGNHQHNLPLKDIVIDQPDTDSRDVLVGLHVLELAGEHAACWAGGHVGYEICVRMNRVGFEVNAGRV